jgi:hypothetical protein
MHGKRYMTRTIKPVTMTKQEESPFIPIVATLVAAICWAIFMLLDVLLWSPNFNLFQNIVILIISIVVAGCIIALMWVFWLFRRE